MKQRTQPSIPSMFSSPVYLLTPSSNIDEQDDTDRVASFPPESLLSFQKYKTRISKKLKEILKKKKGFS